MVNSTHKRCRSHSRLHCWRLLGVLTCFGSVEGHRDAKRTEQRLAPTEQESTSNISDKPQTANELNAALKAALKTAPVLPSKLECDMQVLHELGSGAQGKAFLAKLLKPCYGLDPGTPVVLKVSPIDDTTALKEGMILHYLTSKKVRHTTRYYDMATNGTTILLVESVAAGKGPWEPWDAYVEANTTAHTDRLNVFKQLAEAYLDWCRAGIVHKDSRADNRLVSADGVVTLIDLGNSGVSDNDRNGCARDTFVFQLSDVSNFTNLNVMFKKPRVKDDAVIKSYEQVLSALKWQNSKNIAEAFSTGLPLKICVAMLLARFH